MALGRNKTTPFSVSIDASPLNKLSKELRGLEKEIPGAVSSALNRTIQHVYTKVGRIVTDQYAIKSKEVKDSMTQRKSTRGKLAASIRSAGYPLTYAHFPHTPTSNIVARTLGVKHAKARVKVKIKKSNGYVFSKGGFVAKTGARSLDKVQFNVFRRVGKSRLPIEPIRTLSIPQMISNETSSEKITEIANRKLAERVDHEIKYRLEKASKKMKG